jgi:predicted  nucleic acid-binding Zn-ribbon protein
MAVSEFLTAHKHLAMVLVAAVVLLFVGSKWIDHEETVAHLQADAAHQALAVQESKNEELKALVNTQQQKYETLLSQVTAQNTSLLQALASRNATLQKQKSVNNTSTLPELSKRWADLLKVNPDDFSTGNGKVTVSDSTARSTVNSLEEVPVLKSNIEDQKKLTDNANTLLTGLQNVNTSLKDQVNGLNLQIADQKTSCIAEKKVLEAQVKKAKRNTVLVSIVAVASFALKFIK